MLFFDPTYLLYALPGLVLSLWASVYVKSAFAKYSKVRSSRGMTGAAAARLLLERAGIRDVAIEPVQGRLSDHYDPRTKTLRLSSDVYNSPSLAAVGVACHEAGHAIQHARNYAFLGVRSALIPLTSIGTNMSYVFIIGGMLLQVQGLILIGAILFSGVVLFALATLPVEWNASARAKEAMVHAGILSPQETDGAGTVLNAAFLTYVATAVSSLMILLYYLMRAGVVGGGDD